ncbi:MAG: DNA-3-methyladenine glycosylase [Armatimonadetes bacterium]|nr:DNA-3-methyladenine glycosylase [Armatimonadota bacterium]
MSGQGSAGAASGAPAGTRNARSGVVPSRIAAPPLAAPSDLRPLPRGFFARDTAVVARDLVGAFLVHRMPEGLGAGRIVETEAYDGPGDPASHARTRTARSEIMWGTPGIAYVYLIYGMHCCLNVVTEAEGAPGAVLIRAVEPVVGIEEMRRRRGTDRDRLLASGPGRLTRAFGITLACNGADLTGGPLFIGWDAAASAAPRSGTASRPGAGAAGAEASRALRATDIVATPRIGVIAAKDRLWRFCVRGNPHVSR